MAVLCPYCKTTSTIKKGKRTTKYGKRQRYFCTTCTKGFTETTLNHKVYPPKIILYALNSYNQGYSAENVIKHLNKTYKTTLAKSTILTWVHNYKNLCPIRTHRKHFPPPQEVIFKKRFEHENLDYEYMMHSYKLALLAQKEFPGLFSYLTGFKQGCPDVFFTIGKRCSEPVFDIQIIPQRKQNLACAMAQFAATAVSDNNKRHKLIETFLLINDTATIACETPVWYWEKQNNTGITGHIDLIQIRNNRVYILDYKPDARHQKKAAAQLYHYALALSFRTKIPLYNLRCAWFDEETYYEYNPATVTPPRNR